MQNKENSINLSRSNVLKSKTICIEIELWFEFYNNINRFININN